MEEIFTICDRITVMRDGKSVDTKAIPDTDFDEVVKKMVGRELTERYPARHPSPGEPVLEVKNSFSVRAGEIVGVSGDGRPNDESDLLTRWIAAKSGAKVALKRMMP